MEKFHLARSASLARLIWMDNLLFLGRHERLCVWLIGENKRRAKLIVLCLGVKVRPREAGEPGRNLDKRSC